MFFMFLTLFLTVVFISDLLKSMLQDTDDVII